ncbi:MAG: hypothetical protein JO131_04560 [Gammaproteobacteria bacterium]|nr:hypothetical protein [Gammaproteobacteria bacterium]
MSTARLIENYFNDLMQESSYADSKENITGDNVVNDFFTYEILDGKINHNINNIIENLVFFSSITPDIVQSILILLDDLSYSNNPDYDDCIDGLFEFADEYYQYGPMIIDHITGISSLFAAIILIKQGYIAKGSINILNGILLLGASWSGLLLSCSTVVLTPISFIISSVIDLYDTVTEFISAAKELHIEYWLKEKVSFVNEIEEQIKNSTDIEKKNHLELQRLNVLIEMGCRYRAHKIFGQEEINKLDAQLENFSTKNNKNLLNKNAECSEQDIKINNSLQNEATVRYKSARNILPIKFLNVIGMSFLVSSSICTLAGIACPPVGLTMAAAVICSVVAAYFLIKLGDRIANYKKNKKNKIQLQEAKLSVFYSHFLKSKNEELGTEAKYYDNEKVLSLG